jgi:hypothetical protein
MSRLAELRARREELLARCTEQRAELAQRIAELRGGLLARPGTQRPGSAGLHPLAWVALLFTARLIGRGREMMSLVMFVRSAVAIAARAVQLYRSVAGRRSGGRAPGAAAPEPPSPEHH